MKRNVMLGVCAVIIACLAFAQATAVLLVNIPSKSLHAAFWPVLSRYRGPYVSQGWSLFAPRPNDGNIHVIVRGRLDDGRVTTWYDASQFFVIEMRRDRFTPTRALAEVLAHSAGAYHNDRRHTLARAAMTRTAAMILKKYVQPAHVKMMQLELDVWSIPSFENPLEQSRVLSSSQLSWEPMPHVDAF